MAATTPITTTVPACTTCGGAHDSWAAAVRCAYSRVAVIGGTAGPWVALAWCGGDGTDRAHMTVRLFAEATDARMAVLSWDKFGCGPQCESLHSVDLLACDTCPPARFPTAVSETRNSEDVP